MLKKKNSFKLGARQKHQSERQLKVSQLIHIALVDCLRKDKLLDSRLAGFPITITKVNISADFSIANCYFLPFNTKYESEELLEALELSKYAIRKFVTKKVNLKYSPEIRFYYDINFAQGALIEELFRRIR